MTIIGHINWKAKEKITHNWELFVEWETKEKIPHNGKANTSYKENKKENVQKNYQPVKLQTGEFCMGRYH